MTVDFVKYNPVNDKHEPVKQWVNVPSSLVPQKGDAVRIHHGDYNEEEEIWTVHYRIIDGTDMDKITIVLYKTLWQKKHQKA